MRENVKLFVELVSNFFPVNGTVIEIGSLQVPGQESFADLRPFFPNQTYIGCDIAPGIGVDRIEDAENLKFEDSSANIVLILETIEHLKNPQKAIKEAYRVLKDGGLLIVSSAMNFPVHSYPSDYWRFTPEGIGVLLEDFQIRIIGFQGYELNPHTVFGIGFKNKNEKAQEIIKKGQVFFLNFSSGLRKIQEKISEQSSFKYRLLRKILKLGVFKKLVPLSIFRLYDNSLYLKVYQDSELLSSFKEEIL